jgi:PAS domain S-box-containing protein
LTAGLLLTAILAMAIYLIMQKRAKDSINAQLNFLQTLVNTIPSPIFYKDINGVYLGCNSAFEAYIGRSKAEVVGKTVYDVAPRELADAYRHADLALFNTPGIQQYDASVRCADGSLHDIIFTKATFSDLLGEVAGMVGVMVDITERRRAEKELEQTLAHLENVFENSPDGIGIVDKDGRFIKCNRMAEELHGYTSEEFKGKSAFDMYADKDQLDTVLKILRREGTVKKYAVNLKKRDGTTAIFEISISLLKDDAKRVIGSVCVARDLSEILSAMMTIEASNKRLEQEISERKKAEKEIRRVNRFYDVLSQVNQAIVRIQSRDELLSTVCRLMVERGAVDLAWIGWLDQETSRISPAAHFGNQAQMLSEVHFYADDNSARQGDPGRSIREGKPFVCNECNGSHCLYYTGRVPAPSEFQSCGSFPFRFQGEVCGALTLCIAEQGFFQEREIELLDEVALGISFALDKIAGDSQRDRLNEQYQHQSVFLRTLIDAIPYPVFYKDAEMRYLGCNTAFEAYLGLSKDEIVGKTAHDVAPRELAEVYRKADLALLNTGGNQQYEACVRYADGNLHDIMFTKALFCDSFGKVAGIVGIMLDVSERRRAEEELRRTLAHLENVFENSPDGIAIVDKQGKLIKCNKMAEEQIGCSLEELEGKTVFDLYADKDELDRMLTELRREGAVKKHVINLKKKDGAVVPFEVSIGLLKDDMQRTFGSVGIARDIRERKLAEDFMRVRMDLLEFAASHSLDDLLQKTLDLVGEMTNSPIGFYHFVEADQTTLSLQTWSTRTLNEFCKAEGKGLHYPIAQAGVWVDCVRERKPVIHNDYMALPHRKEMPEGHAEVIRELVAPIIRFDRIVAILGIGNKAADYTEQDLKIVSYLADVAWEIAERKRAEEERARIENQLKQAQKMEALGTLAGGIAHDFNNILGIIMGFTQLAMYELGKGSPVLDKMDEVLKATNRAKDLVKQILAFSRRSEQQKMPLQLGIVVKEAMQILRPSLPSTIRVKTEVLSKSTVLADPTQMHQVLMNLCTNAAHAMQDNGGILEVRLSDVVFETELPASREVLQPGRYVELTVKDSGHGIDPAIIDLIFDPFFTTKGLGEGTGLGLSVLHGIVSSHGGCINVESTPGKGTKFTILIPVLETEYGPKKLEVDTPLPRGQERILLVDDEPLLALTLRQMLENQGYDVVSRISGVEALEAFRHHSAGKPFDLVITDMTMPHFTGLDLARELSAHNPDVPVILMTGFSNKVDEDRAKKMGIHGFLMKPVATAELAAMVRTVLDRKTK